jgi:hypothetical protein
MAVLPLILSWLALGAEPAAPIVAGYRPSGAPAELYALGNVALLRDPRIRSVTLRSNGAAQSNPNEPATVAAIDGPGIVQRLWIGHTDQSPPAPARSNQEHLRVYLDGQKQPALDLTLEELFSGRHPHFPWPMVVDGPAGFVCNIPIPFSAGCRITLEGPTPRAVQVDALRLPDADGLARFDATPTPGEIDDLRLAKWLWKAPDDLFSRAAEIRKMVIFNPEVAEFKVDAAQRSSQRFLLPAGPRTIRSLDVLVTPDTAEAWRGARLRVIWDGDDPRSAGVDLPLGSFYVQAERILPHASLVTSYREHRWANRLPMPYNRQAIVQIDSEQPIKGLIRVRSVPEVDPRAGYLRAALRRGGRPWLTEEGRGHYVGMFLVADGPTGAPRPLGDLVRFAGQGEGGSWQAPLVQYFNGTIDRPQFAEATPTFGFPLIVRDEGAWQLGAFRWQLFDPIVYSQSLRVESESDANAGARDVRAAIFWYSERPGPIRAGH